MNWRIRFFDVTNRLYVAYRVQGSIIYFLDISVEINEFGRRRFMYILYEACQLSILHVDSIQFNSLEFED